MASTIYGATEVQIGNKESNFRYDANGKNSEVFYVNQPVTIASGVVLGATATSTVIGVAQKAATMTASNETVALVKPAFIPADEGIFLMGADADLTVSDSEGLYFPITGATGTIQISVATLGGITGSTGVSRVVEIVKVDPFNEGGTGSGSGLRQAYVRFVKTPYTNVNITA